MVFQLGLPMTVLLSVFMLHERIGLWRGFGMGLTFAGVIIVIFNPKGLEISTGLLLVAAATFMSSLGAVMTKQIEGMRPLTFQAWVGFSSVWPLLALSGLRNPYPGKLGIVAEGALADLLLVNGNPLENLDLMTAPEQNLVLIMKDGTIYKNTLK